MIVRVLCFALTAGVLSQAAFGHFCNTVEVCQNNHCECTLPAENAYGRSFYLDFPNIKKGNNYQFTYSADTISLQLNDSTFPKGVNTPLPNLISFVLNTHTMENGMDHVKIKYYVPPSDIPTEVFADLLLIKE